MAGYSNRSSWTCAHLCSQGCNKKVEHWGDEAILAFSHFFLRPWVLLTAVVCGRFLACPVRRAVCCTTYGPCCAAARLQSFTAEVRYVHPTPPHATHPDLRPSLAMPDVHNFGLSPLLHFQLSLPNARTHKKSQDARPTHEDAMPMSKEKRNKFSNTGGVQSTYIRTYDKKMFVVSW